MAEKKPQDKKSKTAPSKTGKRKSKIARYYDVVYPTRKLQHLLHSNGKAAAKQWAETHDRLAVYRRLTGDVLGGGS